MYYKKKAKISAKVQEGLMYSFSKDF